MTPALRVIAPGLLTTVQDLGRPGFQHLGVPVSGALDGISLRAANALVGNPPETGALEIAYAGPTLAVEADEIRVAVVGAQADIEVLPDVDATGGRRVVGQRSLLLSRGEVLRVGSLSGGRVAYLAVEGGFAIEPVLGSVSTYVRAGIGGLNGRALAAGDLLPLRLDRASARTESRLEGLDLASPPRFRALFGPQRDLFSDDEIAAFFASTYMVGPSSDRMGMRLSGRPIRHLRGFDITSDGVAPGSIQIPGSGEPIVLLADRQTTGGYPKIATVISADLPALGRLPAGATIGFEPVDVAAAEAARRQMFATIAAIPALIVPIAPAPADVAPRLFKCNLISGVVDAAA
jgi:biotin-dependent carboxylase-like uncharacterized protein